MKKLIAAVLVLGFMCASGAWAADKDIMTFDDVTFGKDYKIRGYASVRLLGFKFVNMYAQWDDGKASANIDPYYWHDNRVYSVRPVEEGGQYPSYDNCSFRMSGNEADFAWLKVDVTNLQKEAANFIKDIVIKVIYDDEYEYEGWVRQFNYDFSNSEVFSKYKDAGVIGWPVCLSPVDELSISPMYKGHYALGCTLPNAVIEDNASPLRMIISIGGYELIYNIRK